MALREGSVGAEDNKFWVGVINMAYDIGNFCTTTANGDGMPPIEKGSSRLGRPKRLLAFGTVELFRAGKSRRNYDQCGISASC